MLTSLSCCAGSLSSGPGLTLTSTPSPPAPASKRLPFAPPRALLDALPGGRGGLSYYTAIIWWSDAPMTRKRNKASANLLRKKGNKNTNAPLLFLLQFFMS